MAGPSKQRARVEKQPEGSSNGSSSASRDPTQRSEPKSIPRLDGNRDPIEHCVDKMRVTDLKNISEFLGLEGWYAARGVSTNTLLSQPAHAYTLPSKHLPSPLPKHANRFKLLAEAASLLVLGCI
jgi:eukaryotic translation initiation factor 2C